MNYPSDYGIQEFQRGRDVERAKIVEWLRSDSVKRIGCSAGGIAKLDALAAAIASGEQYEDG